MKFEDFETVIGLEIHVRLNTSSKAFCGDANKYGDLPNHNVSSISLAHPGTLPMVNKSQVEKAIRLGLAIGSKISETTSFDRKHYFYPDLPKGYQLTQDLQPICIGGEINFLSNEDEKKIRIHHIHMEEDAGKLIHAPDGNHSFLDHNRAGTPLLEIVTEPDFRSGQEVHDFMQHLINFIGWLGISDVDLEKGSFRCDCNVSIRKKGATEYGERCEIKNLNSKKFAKQAVESEAKRQFALISERVTINNQTLSFDPVSGKTSPIRSKESAHDYRYFQDPDLPPFTISKELVDSISVDIHPLPQEIHANLLNKGLSDYEAEIICRNKEIAEYFLSFEAKTLNEKLLANILINKILPYLDTNNKTIHEFPVLKSSIEDLIRVLEEGDVSNTVVFQKLIPYLFNNPSLSIQHIIDQLDLRLEKDNNALEMLVKSILDNNPEELKRYKSGKKALFGFFMGEMMKASKGKFDPKEIKNTLTKSLNN